MEGFTIIDGAVALFIIVSALLAYSRGFVRELLAIGGWIVAAIVAFVFAPQAEPIVKEFSQNIPFVKDVVGDSCQIAMVLAFALVFLLALIISSFITPLFSSLVQRSIFGGIDQILGFAFGILRGIVLIAVGYLVYQTAVSTQGIEMIDDSRSARVFAQLTGSVENEDPEQAIGWFNRQYEQLISSCEATE